MTPARKPKPRPPSTTTNARAMPDRGTTSPRPSVKKVVPLRYASVQKLGAIPATFRAEPAPYCIKPKLSTSPTAQTATRMSSEIGPKTLKADSRILRDGTKRAQNLQSVHKLL